MTNGGARLYETRWVTGSSSVYGLNGSLDPASGYDPGGAFSESFEHLCGATAMIRAFDHRTSTWSDWLDLDSDALDCDGPATYLHDQPS